MLHLSYLPENHMAIATETEPNVLQIIKLFTKEIGSKRIFCYHILFFSLNFNDDLNLSLAFNCSPCSQYHFHV